MSLRLNNPVLVFRGFYGANNGQMPLLIGEGRTPLSAAGLMKRRVEVLEMLLSAASGIKYEHFSDLANNPKTEPFYGLLDEWFFNFFDTGTGAPRHNDGRMKVAPAAQYLRSLTLETKLVGGAVPLTNPDYEGLAGVEFNSADVGKYCGKLLSISEVNENPVWLALAEGDNALLSAFADANFAIARERFNYQGKMMSVHAPPVPSVGAAGRLWSIHRVTGDISGSAFCHGLDYHSGRLVG